MSIFSRIKDAIFGASAKAAPASPTRSTKPASVNPSPTATAAPAPAPAPAAPVDVAAVLLDLATKNPQKMNWRTSIVDLMKLVGLDSSLENRKQLAAELGYKGDMVDSATMNVWLHKQVMQQLAAHGGIVPAELKD